MLKIKSQLDRALTYVERFGNPSDLDRQPSQVPCVVSKAQGAVGATFQIKIDPNTGSIHGVDIVPRTIEQN